MEAEEEAEASGATDTPANGVNGKKSEDKAVSEATADLKKASLSEKKVEAAA